MKTRRLKDENEKEKFKIKGFKQDFKQSLELKREFRTTRFL